MTDHKDREKSSQVEQPASSVEALDRLKGQAELLQRENAEAASSLLEQYVVLIKSLDKSSALFREVLAAKNELSTKIRQWEKERAQVAVEEAALVTRELDPRLDDETIVPERDRSAFRTAYEALPEPFKERFAKRLEAVFKNPDEVTVVTALGGAIFEMSRINSVYLQGLETVNTNPQENLAITYRGHKPKKGETVDYSLAPRDTIKDAPIQIDVPIVRDGKPFVYETKSYPRREFGADVQNRN
ncbi:MAG: hypothetical protein WCK01_03650 [Candidatus Uhrbacteria bacterium]